MNKQDLIELIVFNIQNYKTDVIEVADFPTDAITNNKRKITVYNPETITPYKLAHELMHIRNGDMHRFQDYDTLNPQEAKANREALLFLWDLFETQGGSHHDISIFCEFTGCPFYLSYSIISEISNDVIEFLNEEDSRTIEECADEYLHEYDCISDSTVVSIDSFMKRYGINQNEYDLAKIILVNKTRGMMI